MTDETTESSVRASGPGEGARGNREVPPTSDVALDIDALQADRDQLFDRLQRLAAEFDNFRKRNAREQAAFAERANERLVKELIPILDDLGRALEAASEHEEGKVEDGVRLVHRALADLLRKQGLTEIETHGKFDPHLHEALQEASHKLAEAVYASAQQGQTASAAGSDGAAASDDEVVEEGDYEVIDEEQEAPKA